jgi:hypothetical protein
MDPAPDILLESGGEIWSNRTQRRRAILSIKQKKEPKTATQKKKRPLQGVNPEMLSPGEFQSYVYYE